MKSVAFPKTRSLPSTCRAIRAACRKFLDNMNTNNNSRRILHPHWPGPFESEFFTDLGELRGAIGLHIGAIAVMYGVDVEGELANTLPARERMPSNNSMQRTALQAAAEVQTWAANRHIYVLY